VLLDRDGIVNELVKRPHGILYESPLSPRDVRLMPGASEALKQLRAAGYLLAFVTNQPSAAKGIVAVDDVYAVQSAVLDLLGQEGIVFDASRICLHHPEATLPALRQRCHCRKPAPGMLLDVMRQLDADPVASWMVGDTDADVLAGQAAGVRTVLVRNRASGHKRSGRVHPDHSVATLCDAVPIIVSGCDSQLDWCR
jgi:D-glycero-D-manno-heptose 1,7-bisphosphate phosphatase